MANTPGALRWMPAPSPTNKDCITQAVNGANEQDDGDILIQRRIQLALRFSGFEQAAQPLPILMDQGLYHPFW